MYIEFICVRYKNFLSSGNIFTELVLNEYNTNLIIGTNGNGKSTFIDAICFGLFNKPFRKINKPQLVNTINKKNCLVEVEFNAGGKHYLIRRGIKPNIFEIVENGITKQQDSESKDHQDTLEKTILKMNFKTFKQVVILGSANYTPFMQLVAAERREVIEDLLDLQIFTTMNVIVKNKIAELTKTYNQIETKGKLLKQKIELLKKRREEISETNSEFLIENENKIKETEVLINNAEKEILDIETEISELVQKINEQDNPEDKIKKYQDIQRKIKIKKDLALKEVNFFKNHDNCPTCRQNIDDAFKMSVIEEKSKYNQEVTEALNKLSIHIEAAEKNLDIIKKIETKISNKNNMIANKRMYIKTWKDFIKTLKAQNEYHIEKTSQQLDDSDLTNAENEFKITVKEFADLKAEKNNLTIAASILKDGGIKTQLIKKFVPIINQIINKYLNAFEFFVQFELDETFSETIRSRHRDEFSYNSFSEGEKRRIDLAIMLTWRAVAKLRNSASTNLLIMDEILDGPLDYTGKEDLVRILKDVVSDTNFFIISHDSSYKDKFENIISFKKDKNFSIMIKGD